MISLSRVKFWFGCLSILKEERAPAKKADTTGWSGCLAAQMQKRVVLRLIKWHAGEQGPAMLAMHQFRSQIGVQWQVVECVTLALMPFSFSAKRLADLEIAVVEATINALEHGNRFDTEKLISLEILSCPRAIAIRVHDQGTSGSIVEPPQPDPEAKLTGSQTPRGWGLFLMRQVADEVHLRSDTHSHTIELVFFH